LRLPLPDVACRYLHLFIVAGVIFVSATFGYVAYREFSMRERAEEIRSCLRSVYWSLLIYSEGHDRLPSACANECSPEGVSWRLFLFPYLEPGQYSPNPEALCTLRRDKMLRHLAVHAYCCGSESPYTRVIAIDGPDSGFDYPGRIADLCESLKGYPRSPSAV
jgi:hypothetical protein